jgi:hypothetical protein
MLNMDSHDIRRAFFIPARNDTSMKTKILMYKVRRFVFSLFLVKENS